MSDELNSKTPVSFYVTGGLFLVWNLIGLMFYYLQMTLSPEDLASMGPEMAAFMEATPVWANSGYAIAVNAGVVASIALLMKKSWAKPLFVLSFVGVLVQDLDAFVLRDVASIYGSSAFYLPSVVIIICVVEIWYSRSIANRYYG
jgi:hypothetical protein